MRLTELQLQQLRDLPIEGVAERLGLDVVRHKCLCPFHADKHPSMIFDLRRNTCRCFVCQDRSLGPIDLVMKVLNKSFKEACEWLSPSLTLTNLPRRDGTGLSLTLPRREGKGYRTFDPSRFARFFEHPWLSAEARRFLFDQRRLDPRVVHWCRLTSWRDKQGVNWLQTPYYDTEGHLIGLQNRNLGYSQASQEGGSSQASQEGGSSQALQEGEERSSPPRFRFPYGSRCSIYNLPVLQMLRPGEALYIAEGCSDCWSLLSAGHKAIAIPSATLLSAQDKELLQSLAQERQTVFHMYPDQDAPGERLFLQLQQVLPQLVRHALPEGSKDYSDYFLQVIQSEKHLTDAPRSEQGTLTITNSSFASAKQ